MPDGGRYYFHVQSRIQVASPPGKPLMIYDGECNFCTRWIRRWRRKTGEHIDYAPFQTPNLAGRFPEIPPDAFATAVQLVVPDGSVFRAAEAVFRSLALSGCSPWLLK